MKYRDCLYLVLLGVAIVATPVDAAKRKQNAKPVAKSVPTQPPAIDAALSQKILNFESDAKEALNQSEGRDATVRSYIKDANAMQNRVYEKLAHDYARGGVEHTGGLMERGKALQSEILSKGQSPTVNAEHSRIQRLIDELSQWNKHFASVAGTP